MEPDDDIILVTDTPGYGVQAKQCLAHLGVGKSDATGVLKSTAYIATVHIYIAVFRRTIPIKNLYLNYRYSRWPSFSLQCYLSWQIYVHCRIRFRQIPCSADS